MSNEEWDDERMLDAFAVLRDNVVELETDLAERVNAGIQAEDDGRFAPPSIRDILGDLTGNTTDVLTDLAGFNDDEDDEEDSDGGT